MPIPHIFQRSGRRGGPKPCQEPANPAVTARQISAHLGNLLDKAEQADLQTLVGLIEAARVEAERLAAVPEARP